VVRREVSLTGDDVENTRRYVMIRNMMTIISCYIFCRVQKNSFFVLLKYPVANVHILIVKGYCAELSTIQFLRRSLCC